MYLNDLMKKNNMTRTELSRKSCVPTSTLRDILNGHTKLDYCDAGTLYALGKTLNTNVEEILEHYWDESPLFVCQPKEPMVQMVHEEGSLADFYVFVTVCSDLIRQKGETFFARYVMEHNWINGFYERKEYRSALFLLGMVDYILRKHQIVRPLKYEVYRNKCLDRPVYSLATLDQYNDADTFRMAQDTAKVNAVPELKRFNIFMTEDDICRKV